MEKRIIKSYRFEGLPVITRRHVELTSLLYRSLPLTSAWTELQQVITSTLKNLLPSEKRHGVEIRKISNEGSHEEDYKFARDIITIGRVASSDIRISDPAVSGSHAKIVKQQGEYFLLDEGSLNGTYLNEEKIERNAMKLLKDGNVIRVLRYNLIFKLYPYEIVEGHVVVEIRHLKEMSFREYVNRIARPSVLAVIALEPMGKKALLEVDLDFAAALVDVMLGGKGTSPCDRRLVTEIEKGVCEYAILKLIKSIKQYWSSEAKVIPRLEKLTAQLEDEEVQSIAQPDELALVMNAQMHIDSIVGYAKLCLPLSLLQAASAPALGTGYLKRELDHLRSTLSVLDDIKTPLRVEIGSVTLTRQELENLEPSDIVLLDQSKIKLTDEHRLDGEVLLRVGQGKGAGLNARVISSDNHSLKVEVSHMFEEGALEKENESTEGKREPEDGLQEAGALLDEIPVSLRVVIGRRTMSVKEVAQLRVGQVLELKRAPTEPVDLVVDNKFIGKGELVLIEGELGIRILSLATRGT